MQIYAVSGELDPDVMSQSDRKELKGYIASIVGTMRRLRRTWLSVTTHIGIVPEDTQSEVYQSLQWAIEELGSIHMTKTLSFFAIETYFAALKDIGYKSYLTIEGEGGTQPEDDIRKAVQFINKYKY